MKTLELWWRRPGDEHDRITRFPANGTIRVGDGKSPVLIGVDELRYARVVDPEAEEEARALRARLTAVYRDNDLSPSSGSHRTEKP